jgi:hypothetical protein
MFPPSIVPTFWSAKECADHVRFLLSNREFLESKRLAFAEACEKCRPGNSTENLSFKYRKTDNRIIRIPTWYLMHSFFDKFRWAVLCKKPTDLGFYMIEFLNLKISIFRKAQLIVLIFLKSFAHLFAYCVRKLGRRVVRGGAR